MANLMPLVVNARTNGRLIESTQGALEYGSDLRAQLDVLAQMADAAGGVGILADRCAQAADRLDANLDPRPLLADGFGASWVGVPTISAEEAARLIDFSSARQVETAGLPDGYMLWPLGADEFVFLPTDSDPSRVGLDLVAVEPQDADSARLSAVALADDAGTARTRLCQLEMHRNRPDVMHIGMCVEDEHDPCPHGCYEIVRTIAGRPIAVDCGCNE